MKHVDFTHLHVHTQYSLLDGANPIDDLLEQAVSFRMPALAVTDHGNLFGAIEFYQKAMAAGVKPIIGCEMYVAPKSRFDREPSGPYNEYYHLILLAADRTGYKNLIKLVSAAHLEGFYYKPRIDKELLQQHRQGLIGLSGCLRGEIPTWIARDQFENASQAAGQYVEILGKDNFFLEIQANKLEEQEKVNRALVELSGKLSLPLVATNDCHYLRRADAKAHDILLCLQTGKTVSDPNRMRFGTDEHYFKSHEEMQADFSELPQALLATKEIAERCNLDLVFDAVHLPHYQVPAEYTREQYLESLAREGLALRLKDQSAGGGPGTLSEEAYHQRLSTELSIITSMGYAGYFLIVWDIVNFARSKGIPVGPGRGSAAGSLAAYALRITDIDPLRYGLLFERFLNPDRITLPDIDMDFCVDRREEVIRYVTQKFGSDHVCQIITFGTLEAKAVIRDVGRVLELPYAEADRLAKLIPNTIGISLDEAMAAEPRLNEAAQADPKVRELLTLAKSLEGLARHASTHAAGVVISDQPLTEHVPLYHGANDEIVTQYPMGDLEKIGLIKFDLLGLRTLTVIDQAVKLINKKRPPDQAVQIMSLPLTDPKTYELLGSGETAGVFQLESTGMRDLLVKLKPERFEDLIALLALYRPGPIGSGMVDDFIKRKRGQIPMKYELPQLEEILKETYGVIVYQEQVMKIANVLAGFSMGQADLLRRAMGKKKPEEMEKQKVLFIKGAQEHHKIPEKKAEKIFDLMAYFAGYGFNKSHSAAYALISYQTAYLKTHYPTEFMAALLSSVMGNADKIVRYITECRDLGIRILPPDVNESRRDFTVVEEGIRFGLAAIKNVGEGAIEFIRTAREEGGPFASLLDFCRRVDLHKVNRRAIEGLIKSGAFDSTGGRRAQLTAFLEQAMQEGAVYHRDLLQGQAGLFIPTAGQPAFEVDPLPDVEEWEESQLLRLEKESLGFYITSHPLARHAAEIRNHATATSEGLEELSDGQEVRLCGIIAGQKITTTKRGDKMAYLRLEDLQGTVEVIVFPDLYKKVSGILALDTPFLVTGFMDRTEKGVKIKATHIEPLTKFRERTTRRADIHLQATGLTAQDLQRLKEILLKHQGSCPVYLYLRMPNKIESTIAIDEQIRIKPSDLFIADIERDFGKGTVAFY